jgi:hypothetical protein
MGGSRMSPSIALAAAAAFALLLLLLRTMDNAEQAGHHSIRPAIRNRPRNENILRPAALAVRIFSREDMQFIQLMRSPRLQRLYLQERRKVAAHWVRRTAAEVREIMSVHRLTSRQSANLKVTVELKLFLQYLELRLLCGMLLLLIYLFGPHALVNLASYTGELSQRIGKALPDLEPASQVMSAGNMVGS